MFCQFDDDLGSRPGIKQGFDHLLLDADLRPFPAVFRVHRLIPLQIEGFGKDIVGDGCRFGENRIDDDQQIKLLIAGNHPFGIRIGPKRIMVIDKSAFNSPRRANSGMACAIPSP